MGADVFCLICGGPHFITTYDENDNLRSKKEMQKYTWISKVTGINNKEERISFDKYEIDDYGSYKLGKDHFELMKANWHEFYVTDYGVAAHNDCLKLLETKLNYSLRFADVCGLVNEYYNTLNKQSSYKEMAKYQEQWFLLDEAFKENSWLIDSPLINKKNQERVLNIWKPLVTKFKKNEPRPSPCESATTFKKGTILTGNDKNLWIVKDSNGTKRWIKYEENDNQQLATKVKKESIKSKKVSRKGTKKVSRKGTKKGSIKLKKGSKKGTRKRSKKESQKGTKKGSKKGSVRPSPSDSATDYPIGTIKVGNDMNKWIIVEDKNGVHRWRKK